MVYVCSDLHGYPLKKFQKLLKKISFSENDTLYILGDILDRNGDGGIEMYRWAIRQDNIKMIKGNHESMLLSCLGEFSDRVLTWEEKEDLKNYRYNGGIITICNLKDLKKDNSQEFDDIISYIGNLPLYLEVTVNDREYLFVHGGFGDFSKDRSLDSYEEEELVWERPELDTEYFDSKTVILGHTPTAYYGNEYKGKILYTPTWIDIDVGAAYGYDPVILRLDDMKEFSI